LIQQAKNRRNGGEMNFFIKGWNGEKAHGHMRERSEVL
jgi:hypothetical protein